MRDDPAARRQVAGWLATWFGWRDVIELGHITLARSTEMLVPPRVRLFGALGTPDVRVSRRALLAMWPSQGNRQDRAPINVEPTRLRSR